MAVGANLSDYSGALAVGDIVMMAVDLDNNKLYWGVNGTFFNSGDPANGTGASTTIQADTEYVFGLSTSSSEDYFVNFGQDSTFGGETTAGNNTDANGVGDFKYTVPTGFQCLASSSLTAPTHQGIDQFNTVLYTGNGSARSITTDIAPAWVWIKNRSQADEHKLVDIVRGVQKELSSDDASNAEQTDSNGVTAFGSSSFSLGSGANGYNDNTENFIAWCWAAGTAFSNDASATGIGTLDSSGRVSEADHFSIVSYTGSGANASIKHGLSAAPEMYWVRDRTDGNDWNVYHVDSNASPASGSLRLDNATAFNTDSTVWNGVPSSTVVNLGTSDETNKLNNAFIAYCFRSVPGCVQSRKLRRQRQCRWNLCVTGI